MQFGKSYCLFDLRLICFKAINTVRKSTIWIDYCKESHALDFRKRGLIKGMPFAPTVCLTSTHNYWGTRPRTHGRMDRLPEVRFP